MVQRWIALGLGMACAAGVLFHARAGEARPEYTRRTKKECLFCHPADSFRLTEAGEYYRDHRTLDGYQPKEKSKQYDQSAAIRAVR
jgi:hypothetical protein